MFKKRLRKWNLRKRRYREAQDSTPASSHASPEEMSLDAEYVVTASRETHTTASLTALRPSGIEAFERLELVLDSIFSWSQGKLETRAISSDPMSKYLANPNQPPIQDSRTMYRTFELVFDLWKHGDGALAGKAARKGFYALEYVLTDDHPDVIWHILDTIYDMVDMGHLQLVGMFLDHAAVLAHSKLPSQHPLYRILHQLRICDYQTSEGRQYMCFILRQAWLRNVNLLGQHIASADSRRLWLYEQLIWDGRTRLRKCSDLKAMQDKMIQALGSLAHTEDTLIGDASSEKLRVDALMLEFTQMDLGDKTKAEHLALRLLRNTETFETRTRSSARFHAYARKMLARIHEGRSDFVTAEQNLRRAIAMREAAHGANNSLRVVRDMWVLAAYFERVGRDTDAKQVAQDAMCRAQRFLEDVPSEESTVGNST
jgi:hypothetical protein